MVQRRLNFSRLHFLVLLATGFGVTGWASMLAINPASAIALAIFLPVFYTTFLARTTHHAVWRETLSPQSNLVNTLSKFLGEIEHPTVALVVELDDYDRFQENYGAECLQTVLNLMHSTIEENLTDKDITLHLDGARFAAALAPQAPFNKEAMLQVCTRIQNGMALIPNIADLPLQITASIGFAASDRLMRPTGDNLYQAALAGLADAKRRSPGAVRGYSEHIAKRQQAKRKIVDDAKLAFVRGELFAFFQPQIDLHTGNLSGFEALTRWHHPEKGILAPSEFLHAFEQAGLLPRLAETMVSEAVHAIRFWDQFGLDVPRVGVNFTTNELQDPQLVDCIANHLDGLDLAPSRLNVEIKETIIAARPDDDTLINLATLADLGCGIELDDFGAGYASIGNIRKFSINRIKINRSFINGIAEDADQREIVAAMMTMAERLNLSVVAAGIETKQEYNILQQMGCQFGQGFHIARPMPLQETVEWANAYFKPSLAPTRLSRKAG